MSGLCTDPRQNAKTMVRRIIIFGSLILLALWSVATASIVTADRAAMDRTKIEARNLAASFSGEVSHLIQNIGAAMDILADRMRAENGHFDIYSWARNVPLFAWTTIQGGIVGPDGHLVSTTLDPNPQPINFSDREHIRVHLDGHFPGLFIGKAVVGRLSGQVTIQISRRVDAADGHLLGIIVFALSPAQLTTLPRSIDLGARGVITLVGVDNVIRARFTRDQPDGLSGVGETVAGGGFRPTTIPENGEGFFVRDSMVDGVTRLFSYKRMADQPLVVTVGLDLDEALISAKRHGIMVGSLAGAATLLLIALAAYLIREINRRAAHEVQLRLATSELAASKEQAEAASHAKSMFLANMSHELRTPLNAVIGFAELIGDQNRKPIDALSHVEYAQHILQSGQHLLTLIDGILDLTKLEAHKLSLNEGVLSLPEIVSAAVSELGDAAHLNGVNLRVEIADPFPSIQADPLRLKQIVVNLLSNAIKFSREGATVLIFVGQEHTGDVVVFVTDRGVGMTAEEIRVALEPFGQSDNTWTKIHDGVGLGLPLAKQLAELHGGSLDIESTPGSGTIVRLRLPASRVVLSPPTATAEVA